MNIIHRSIWNDQTGTFVAVSENTRSAGKKISSCTSAAGGNASFSLKILTVSLMMACGAGVQAQPVGGVVSAGSATIGGTAGNMTITQTTPNVAINWQSFGIQAGQSVQFVQPGSSSVALNRVIGTNPSNILGNLSANGKVFLVNPNGILFGQGASVNVGGLVASTLAISDANFMANNFKFSGAGAGSVVNQGTINAANGGYVALLGANVSNQGVIAAQLGTVALAAGNAVTLDMAGDKLLNVTVDQGAVNALVDNGGMLRADGGQVLMTTQAAGSLLANAVNNTGVVQAQTLVTGENGTIMLLGGMDSGTVNVGGTLDASAPNGGNGGFIETSAARVKIADGTIIRTQSVQGKAGTWLIDPVDFTIASSGGDITPGALATALAGNVIISSVNGSAGTNGDINVNNDVTWNAATTLTLNAVNDVNFNAAVTASNGGSLVANAGHDVVVKANVVTGITTTGGNISWTAGRDIQVNSNLPGQTGVTATFAAGNTGNITWIAGRDVNIGSAVTATGGDFTVCCARDIKVNAATTTTDGDTIMKAGRDIIINAAMTTTRGDVILRAGSLASAAVPGLIGGTVVFTPGTVYTVNSGSTPNAVTVDYTPASYATPNNYSVNFTGSGAAQLQSHMLVFAQGNDKVYDGNRNATLSFRGDPTLGGNVTLVPGTGLFDTKDVGTGKPITYTGYSLGGADAAKFALWGTCTAAYGSGTTTANITPAPLTLKANDATKVYGQTFTPSGTAFTTPVAPVAGETVTSVAETSTGTAPTASVGGSTYPIVITPGSATGNAAFNQANYTITYQNGALLVNPAQLTLKANDNTKVYGQTFTPLGTAFTVVVAPQNGETVTGVTETTTGTAATVHVAGSPYPITITPGSETGTVALGNYNVTLLPGQLTVTPAPLTLTANDQSKVYGTALPIPGTAFTATPLQNADSIASVTMTSAGTPATAHVAGSPYPITITPGSETGGTFVPTDYTVNYVPGKMVVTPAPLTLTANDQSKVYGTALPIPGTAFTSTTLQNSDAIDSVTMTSTGTPATATVAGSPYPIAITPGSETGGTFVPTDYTVNYVPGTMVVTPVAVTPPVVTPPVVTPPVVTPPVVTPPVNFPPPVIQPVPPTPVPPAPVPPSEVPLVVVPPAAIPPTVLRVVQPPAPVVVPVEVPVVTPAEKPPQPYVPPVRIRKQDRN